MLSRTDREGFRHSIVRPHRVLAALRVSWCWFLRLFLMLGVGEEFGPLYLSNSGFGAWGLDHTSLAPAQLNAHIFLNLARFWQLSTRSFDAVIPRQLS